MKATKSWMDQAATGDVLAWSRHDLAGVMEALDRPELAFEARIPKVEEVEGETLVLVTWSGDVSWDWGAWSRIHRRLRLPPGFEVAAEPEGWIERGSVPRLDWNEFPLCDAIELTPQRDPGGSGATTCIPRPEDLPHLACTFRYDGRGSQCGVRVELPPAAVKLRRDSFEALALTLVGHSRFQVDARQPVAGGKGFLPLEQGFSGVVAAVAERAGHRLLLDAITVFDQRIAGRSVSVGEWRAVRRAVGIAGSTRPIWPERSQNHLEALHAVSEEMHIADFDALFRKYPRGALRAVVLSLCARQLVLWEESELRSLDAAASPTAWLATKAPKVAAAMADYPAADERLWLLQNATDPGLEAAIEWVGAAGLHGAPALANALRLTPLRARLDRLLELIREGCKEAKTAAAWRRALDESLQGAALPRQLENDIQQLEAAVAGPPDIGKPPIQRRAYKRWSRRQAERSAWRAQVAAVLGFCEEGTWAELDRTQVPTIEALRIRALRLDKISDSEHADHEGGEELRRRTRQVLDSTIKERPSADLDALIKQLRRRVLPCSPQWAGLHRLIREALDVANDQPWLAEALGVSNPDAGVSLMERAARAQELIGLVHQLNKVAARMKPFASDLSERLALLTTPKHPRIVEAAREFERLRTQLAGARELDTVTDPPALAPRQKTASGFRVWWKELAKSATSLARLRARRKDLELWCRGTRNLVGPWLDRLPQHEQVEFRELVTMIRDSPASVPYDRVRRVQDLRRKGKQKDAGS